MFSVVLLQWVSCTQISTVAEKKEEIADDWMCVCYRCGHDKATQYYIGAVSHSV